MKKFSRSLISIGAAFMMVLFLIAPVLAIDATSVDSSETVINPTPAPGSSFDVPVVAPGVNIIITFTLDNNGQLGSVSVTGAPDGANVVQTSEGVKITFQSDGATKVIEVNVDVESEDGRIVSVKVEREIENEIENEQDATETPEFDGEHHQENEDNEAAVNNGPGSSSHDRSDQTGDNEEDKHGDDSSSQHDD